MKLLYQFNILSFLDMNQELWILGIAGAISGIVSYQVYESTGLLSALTVLVFCGWVLFNLRSGMAVWNSLSTLLNPFVSFFNIYLISFTYLSFQGQQFTTAASRSLGLALLGMVFSMLVHKYWNI